MRAGYAARAAGTLSRGEGPGPRAAQAGLPNPWPGRRTGVVRGSWAVLSWSGGAAAGRPRPVLTISLSKTAPGMEIVQTGRVGLRTDRKPPTILLSDAWGQAGMVHPRGGSRGGRLSGLRTIRSRGAAGSAPLTTGGRCRRPAKTRGAGGAEGDPGPARGRRVQRRCPTEGRSGRRRVVGDRGDRFPRPRRAATRSATSPVTAPPPPHSAQARRHRVPPALWPEDLPGR